MTSRVVKVEVGKHNDDKGWYNFIVHYKGEKIKSTVRLGITVDNAIENYLDKGYDIDQFKGSMKIFFEHKDKEIIETVRHITHEYFYNGGKTPVIQAQEISDWLDDHNIDWDEGWEFEEEEESEDPSCD